MTPGRESLRRLIERAGPKLSDAQYHQLWAYHGRLRAANATLNLTRIHQFDNMVIKHYVDSLLVLDHVEPSAPLMDLGSGPGLPGIVLAIARPDLDIVLAEPRGARADFLKETVAALGLSRVEVIDRKITPRFDRAMGSVITRAVATIPETLELVMGCLGPGGRVIFMKGPECDDEIAEARATRNESFRLSSDVAYTLPGTSHRRRLVMFERMGDATTPPRPAAREVLSESNSLFRKLRSLLRGPGIREHRQALISGSKVIAEVLARDSDRALAWVTDAATTPEAARELPRYRLSNPLFAELDVAGTRSPLLLVDVPAPETWTDDDWPEGCTLFLPFQDPENVGATIRSAAALGAARVVLLRESAHPFHPKSVRAAGSALFRVPLLAGPTLAELATATVPLIALSTEGPALDEQPWPDRFGLVAGVEGPGLPPGLRQGLRRRIPIAPGVESLNAAASVAVALYDWRRSLSVSPPLPDS